MNNNHPATVGTMEAESPTTAPPETKHKNRRVVVLAFVVVAGVVVFGSGFGSGVAFSNQTDDRVHTNNSAKGSTNTIAGPPPPPNDTVAPCADLMNDVRVAVRVLASNYIEFVCDFYFRQGLTAGFDQLDNLPRKLQRATAFEQKPTRQRTSLEQPGSFHSWGTNNQHASVQEEDIVQSNGTHIFIVYGNDIVIVNAVTMKVSNRTAIPQTDLDDVVGILLLENENRLVVFLYEYTVVATEAPIADDDNSTVLRSDGSGLTNTTIFVYESNTMTLLDQQTLPGSFVAARAIESNVHVATRADFDVGWDLEMLNPAYIGSLTTEPLDEQSYRDRALDELELQLQVFLERLAPTLDCESIVPWNWMPFTNATHTILESGSVATIASFDAGLPNLAVNLTRMLLPTSEWNVYASTERIVLSCTTRETVSTQFTTIESEPLTYLAVLTLEDASTVVSALGLVPGRVNAPSAMDHFHTNGNDFLHVLSTAFDLYSFASDPSGNTSLLDVYVLDMSQVEVTDKGNVMPLVGQLIGLGKPKDVMHSVVFKGHRAFLTSANDTTSFYALNMSDPTDPHILHELEISGYVTSMHDIGPDLMLSIGADGATQGMFGRFGSLQLSLYNVSDFGPSRLVQQWKDTPPSVANVSESVVADVEYNRKAFRYLVEEQVLILPLTVSQFQRRKCSEIPSNVTSEALMWANETGDSWTTVFDYQTNGSEPVITGCYQELSMGNTFDGFRLYGINDTSISPFFSIDSYLDNCGIDGLFPRSLAVNGTVITLQGNVVKSHDLSTKAEVASIGLDSNCSIGGAL